MQTVVEWRDISEYEGLYEISNKGQVKSLSRRDRFGKPIRERILKPYIGTTGYEYVNLSNNGVSKHHKIHRLVANAFLPLDIKREFVNHIDGNKLNNCAENLEFCTQLENVRHAISTGLFVPGVHQRAASEGRKKPVCQYDREGNFIALYACGKDVTQLFGMNPSSLSQCLHGKTRTSRSYIWKLLKEECE